MGYEAVCYVMQRNRLSFVAWACEFEITALQDITWAA